MKLLALIVVGLLHPSLGGKGDPDPTAKPTPQATTATSKPTATGTPNPTVPTGPASLTLSNFPAYPGYTDSLKPAGSVKMTFVGDSVTFEYDLTGIDSTCTKPKEGTANSCGIHFHSGTSCASAGEVGGHWYKNTTVSADPWTYGATYTATSLELSGVAKGSVKVTFGYSKAETMGRAFVLHDYEGVRIACSLLESGGGGGGGGGNEAESLTLSNFGAYPGYTGSLKPAGSVKMSFAGTGVTFEYDLTGVDLNCTKPQDGKANSCGIHFHKGTSCATADEVGGHWFNNNTVSEDPWTFGSPYAVDASGVAKGSVKVTFGYSKAETMGHAFVLHDYAGARIACSLLTSGNGGVPTPEPSVSSAPVLGGSPALVAALALLSMLAFRH